MKKVILPIDTKSLYFNIQNDNKSGHTATVASPIKKTLGEEKLENVYLLKNKEIDISNKAKLVDLLVKHSKTKVVIRNVYAFKHLSVNGKPIDSQYSFGFYIKEETDDTKVQFGRLKLHYPSKFVYEDEDTNINNKEVYKALSNCLNNYAFIVNSFEYICETDTLNFDALIVGENNIPYSKVFINEKGAGNKFNFIFNENADDYDREIISLRKKYGDEVNTYNYLDYFKQMKDIAIDFLEKKLNIKLFTLYKQYPYSLFDFYYLENNIKKYGILRVTGTKNKYFNLSLIQQLFMMKTQKETTLYLVYDIFDKPKLSIYSYEDLNDLAKTINSLKYEDD